jgi:hypothetical protein
LVIIPIILDETSLHGGSAHVALAGI